MSTEKINEKPQRSWVSNDDDSQMRCYLGMQGRVTLHQLIAHFEDNYPHVDPMHLELNYATAVWEEPPTAEDLAKRDAGRAEKAQRNERWERATYERLKTKFGLAGENTQ